MNKPVKNPGVAVVLSFFWCGLGQIYNGEGGKAAAFMIGWIVSAALLGVGLGLVALPIVWIAGMVDAYQSAERSNNSDEYAAAVRPVYAVQAVENADSDQMMKWTAVGIGVVLLGAVLAVGFMDKGAGSAKKADPGGVTEASASAAPAPTAAVELPPVGKNPWYRLRAACLQDGPFSGNESALKGAMDNPVMLAGGCAMVGVQVVSPADAGRMLAKTMELTRKENPGVTDLCATEMIRTETIAAGSGSRERRACIGAIRRSKQEGTGIWAGGE